MTTPAVFPYRQTKPSHAGPTLMPVMPIRLGHGSVWADVEGLVDSGAMVNVLPHALGLRFGLDWGQAPLVPPVSGTLARHPAKAVVLNAVVAGFPRIQLGFAWSSAPDAPLLLGQMNFFFEFDVCFFRSRGEFHVQPRTP
jgi:hypothetical protein